MKLNSPTQWFGLENTAKGLIPLYESLGLKNGHNGIDWSCVSGTPLYWDVDTKGVVYRTVTDSKGGIGLDIISKDEDTGQFYKHRFWHLEKYAVKMGDIVETGDLIAYADNTGLSTASHLHRGLKPVYKGLDGGYYNELAKNGYWGAIDQVPFMKNIFVKDYVDNQKGQLSILKKLVFLFEELISNIKYENRKRD